MFLDKSNVKTIAAVQPYTPLEVIGRDIFIREGCYNCHSQLVRPFRHETERYGEYAKAGEYVYDRPFQWGSKRTGPDLLRVGGKYPNLWHVRHMEQPTSTTPGSLMPPYPFLLEDDYRVDDIEAKLSALRTLGVPYDQAVVDGARDSIARQARVIADDVAAQRGPLGLEGKEITALTAYLQRLGTDIKWSTPEQAPVPLGVVSLETPETAAAAEEGR
jgi:cytochrome c oxidase cbb3-type subunit I/II